MICAAPSRLAAITPHSPTAPSPMTATVLPGDTCAAKAAWCPVPITSVSVSSDGIKASSAATGKTTRVPSAWGTRTASPCPPSTSPKPYLPPWRQALCSPRRQNTQVPSDQRNGETTSSPALIVRTSSPTASTTPMNSCPIRRPVSLGSIDLYGQRSLPQIPARVTRTSASVESIRRASGTFSIRTSPAPYITVARIRQPSTRGAAAFRFPTLLSLEIFISLDGAAASTSDRLGTWLVSRTSPAPHEAQSGTSGTTDERFQALCEHAGSSIV